MFHKANKENNMGIHFANQNRITSSNSLKLTYSLRIYQVILILLGVLGPIYGFISGLEIAVLNRIVIGAIILSTIYYFIIFQFPTVLKYTLTSTIIIYFIAVFEFLDEIRNGFWHIENYCINYLNSYYQLEIYTFVVGDYDKEMVISIFIIFVIIVFAGVASSVILFNYFGGAYIILSSTLVIFPLTVGLIPGNVPIALYLIFLICIVGMSRFTARYNGSSIRKSHKKQWKLNVNLGNRFRYVIGLKVGIVLSIILTLLFLIVPYIFSSKSYEELNIQDTKTRVQDKLMNFSIEEATNKLSTRDFSKWTPFSTSKSYGGLSGGDLGNEGEVTFDNKTVLNVEMQTSYTPVYLKGYVGSVYTGNKWESLSEEDELMYNEIMGGWRNTDFVVGNQSSYFLSLIDKLDANVYRDFRIAQNTMKVTNVRSNKEFSYAPYHTLFEDNTMNVVDPLYVFPYSENDVETFMYYTNYADIFNFTESDEYLSSMTYFSKYAGEIQIEDTNTLDKIIEYRNNELKYREFVYSAYTKLSDKVPTSLVRDFGDDKYSQDGIKTEGKELKDYLIKVANYLEDNTTYSLKPGPLPKGKDYVEYFLYENKVGYCAHYATAATIMLRIMGVPARYVEGYLVKDSNILAGKEVGRVKEHIRGDEHENSVSIKEVKVLDSNAHAWVEVYIDGYGFVPVEFTSGVTQSDNGELNPSVINQIQPTNIPSTLSPHDYEEEDSSVITPSITLAPTKVPGTSETIQNENIGDDNAGETSSKLETPDNINLADENAKPIYIMKLVTIILRVIIVIVLFIAMIIIRWIYITYNNKSKIKSSNKDKVVLLRYKELLRMLSYNGIEINQEPSYQIAAMEVEEKCNLLQEGELEEFTAVALKARFSPNKISEEEAEMIELYYKEGINSIYNNKSFMVKIYLRYIKVFV